VNKKTYCLFHNHFYHPNFCDKIKKRDMDENEITIKKSVEQI